GPHRAAGPGRVAAPRYPPAAMANGRTSRSLAHRQRVVDGRACHYRLTTTTVVVIAVGMPKKRAAPTATQKPLPTSFRIPLELLRQAKRRAIDEGKSVQDLVIEGLQLRLAQPKAGNVD